jgi:cytochrome c oxidase subunit 3
MNFFAEIVKKPWLEVPDSEIVDGPMFLAARSTIGFRIFIGIVTVLFILMTGAYADRLVLGDWRAMPELPMLWLNTLFLVLGSLAMHRAVVHLDGDLAAAKKFLLIGAALSLGFVGGQLAAWNELVSLGYFAASNPANAFFYMITGLHGVHVLGGLVVLVNAMIRVWGGVDSARLRTVFRLCATYWHFLLIVWLAMFALFLLT